MAYRERVEAEAVTAACEKDKAGGQEAEAIAVVVAVIVVVALAVIVVVALAVIVVVVATKNAVAAKHSCRDQTSRPSILMPQQTVTAKGN
jgi:hypothetical protein